MVFNNFHVTTLYNYIPFTSFHPTGNSCCLCMSMLQAALIKFQLHPGKSTCAKTTRFIVAADGCRSQQTLTFKSPVQQNPTASESSLLEIFCLMLQLKSPLIYLLEDIDKHNDCTVMWLSWTFSHRSQHRGRWFHIIVSKGPILNFSICNILSIVMLGFCRLQSKTTGRIDL